MNAIASRYFCDFAFFNQFTVWIGVVQRAANCFIDFQKLSKLFLYTTHQQTKAVQNQRLDMIYKSNLSSHITFTVLVIYEFSHKLSQLAFHPTHVHAKFHKLTSTSISNKLERVVMISHWAAADDLHMLSHHCACADRQLLISD